MNKQSQNIKERFISINISPSLLNHKLANCDEEYIRKYCKGACCRFVIDKTDNEYLMIILLPEEQLYYHKKYGVKVKHGLLWKENGKCPFQLNWGGCKLHNTGDKPFQCSITPFKIRNKRTLYVRKKRLRKEDCKMGNELVPIYKSFSQSLKYLFGEEGYKNIEMLMNVSDSTFHVNMPLVNYINYFRWFDLYTKILNTPKELKK